MAIDIHFIKQVQTRALVRLNSNAEEFSAATNGGFVIGSPEYVELAVEKVMLTLDNVIFERNPFSDKDVASKEFGQLLERGIKKFYGAGPVVVKDALLELIGSNPAQARDLMADAVAQQALREMISAGTTALSNALPAELTTTTATATPAMVDLIRGVKPLGSGALKVAAYVMSPDNYLEFIAGQVEAPSTAGGYLFQYGDISVARSPNGKPLVMLDGFPETHVLALAPGAVVIEPSALHLETDVVLGKENIKHMIQGEGWYNMQLRGFSWAKEIGSKVPVAAQTDGSVAPTVAQITVAGAWVPTRPVTDGEGKRAIGSVKINFAAA